MSTLAFMCMKKSVNLVSYVLCHLHINLNKCEENMLNENFCLEKIRNYKQTPKKLQTFVWLLMIALFPIS